MLSSLESTKPRLHYSELAPADVPLLKSTSPRPAYRVQTILTFRQNVDDLRYALFDHILLSNIE